MLAETDVLGVIVLYNNNFEQAYTRDAQETLEILAGQAAVALQNQRLYETQLRAQEQKTAAENMAVMSMVAAEFAHKMNNLAGTIPVRINRSIEQLDATNPRDEKILKNLTQILKEAEGILRAAQEIRESSEPGFKEELDVNRLLEIAISRAINTQENVEDRVKVTKTFMENLPVIKAERSSFIDALTSMIKNSFEAIQGSGSLTVDTSLGKLNNEEAITIKISDTGQGIPQSELPKIFDLFYTTKGEKGLGFGLWRDKIFFKKLGGEIDVDSEINAGTTFTIRIPVRENMKA
jgi:signal transduction histidine kinase